MEPRVQLTRVSSEMGGPGFGTSANVPTTTMELSETLHYNNTSSKPTKKKRKEGTINNKAEVPVLNAQPEDGNGNNNKSRSSSTNSSSDFHCEADEYSALVAAAVANILASKSDDEQDDHHDNDGNLKSTCKTTSRITYRQPAVKNPRKKSVGYFDKVRRNGDAEDRGSRIHLSGDGTRNGPKKKLNRNIKRSTSFTSGSLFMAASTASAAAKPSKSKSFLLNPPSEAPISGFKSTSNSTSNIVVSPPPSNKCPVAPLAAKNPTQMELTAYITKVQEYINQLEYHRQGEPATKVLTSMSVKHQVDTAKLLIKSGDHIKCLHALVLGIYFTNCTNYVERFPINFRSVVNGKEYKHVVLGLYMYGMFGAVGISRDPGLQDKPAVYPKLYDLILEFQKCYGQSGHVLKEVRIGGIITHDPHSLEPIHWKLASPVDMQEKLGQETAFEKITRLLRSKMGPTCLRSSRRASATPPASSSPETPAAAPSTKIKTFKKDALKTKSKTIANINTSSKDSVKNPKA